MSSGGGSEFCRSDHVIPQHGSGEAGPCTRYASSGTEHYRSGSYYVNTRV
jgi:hypothetical protein